MTFASPRTSTPRRSPVLSQTTIEMRGSRSIRRSLPWPSSETHTLNPPSRNSCQTGVSRMLPSDRCSPITATSGSSNRSPMSSRVRLRRISGIVAEMPRSPLADAFGHHVWATTRLIDVCESLTDEQLATTAEGTYGSVIDTLRHLVASDRSYLALLSGGRVERVDDEHMTLADLRAVMVEDGAEWSRVVAELDDPDKVLVRKRPDGSSNRSPAGIRLAPALHHGTDHRSQICTILTTLGIEPPDIDVWEFGLQAGRTVEVPAPA